MALVAFAKPFSAGTADPIKLAEDVQETLKIEFDEIVRDVKLNAGIRRDLILKYAKAINQCMPNAELYAARKALREDEAATGGKKLGGEVTSVKTSGTRHIRADAAKRPKRR